MEKLRRGGSEKVQLTGDAYHGIGGMRIGTNVFLPACSPLEFLSKLFHETGHVAGEDLSFKTGEVLLPDETKKTRVALSDQDIRSLQVLTLGGKLPDTSSYLLPVANAVVRAFTKENFNLSLLTIYPNTPVSDMEAMVAAALPVEKGIIKDDNENLFTVYTKDGRNNELSAFTAQAGCLQLLANTLRFHGMDVMIHMSEPLEPSHRAAQQIVKRAYMGTNWILPSIKDTMVSSTNE